MINLPFELNYLIFSHLSLLDLQHASIVCKSLNHLTSDRIIKKIVLKNTDFKILNLNFILTYHDLLSTKDMLELNFKRITRKKLWEVCETHDTMTVLRKMKLIASLYLFKEFEEEKSVAVGTLNLDSNEIYKYQHPYHYLISLACNPVVEILRLRIEKSYSLLKPAMFCYKSIEKIKKQQEELQKEINQGKINLYCDPLIQQLCFQLNEGKLDPNAITLPFDYNMLKVHDREALVDIFRSMWEKYSVNHFSSRNSEDSEYDAYVAPEIFESFCNTIHSKHQKSLVELSFLILAEQQTQALIKILPGLQINSLCICLTSDIKPHTMQKLADILCSEDFIMNNSESSIYIELLTNVKQHQFLSKAATEEEKLETKKIFLRIIEKFESLNLLMWSATMYPIEEDNFLVGNNVEEDEDEDDAVRLF